MFRVNIYTGSSINAWVENMTEADGMKGSMDTLRVFFSYSIIDKAIVGVLKKSLEDTV